MIKKRQEISSIGRLSQSASHPYFITIYYLRDFVNKKGRES